MEVTTQTKEELHLIDLDHKPRPEKAALEARWFDGGHEVRFTERSFQPRHDADLDEIRAFVDALEVRRRELPPIPEPPRAAVAPLPAVPDHYRAPLEAVLEGALVGVETVHRVGTGTVVEARWEDRQGALQRGLYLVEGETARPYDAVATAIDRLPEPPLPAAEPAPAAAELAPEPQPAAKPKKGLFGLGRTKDKATEQPERDPAPAPEAKPKKGLFGLGRSKDKQASEPEPEPKPEPEQKTKKRFGFGRK